MKHIFYLLWMVALPALAQSIELSVGTIEIRSDLQLRIHTSESQSQVARIGNIAIVPNDAAGGESLSMGRARFLGAGYDPVRGRFGLLTNEITFKLKAGLTSSSIPRGLVARQWVGPDMYIVQVGHLNELTSALQLLKNHPAIEWADANFVTELNKPN